jgi:hypothetical protein
LSKYLPLFHHFKAVYQFPKHIFILVKIVANASLNNFLIYYDQVHDIYLVSKMDQIIKVQRPVSSASISSLYVILEAAFTTALLGVLLYNFK